LFHRDSLCFSIFSSNLICLFWQIISNLQFLRFNDPNISLNSIQIRPSINQFVG
jgi:hypothetical protein